jgi:ubiquitin-conjugating enzyme E2 Z
LEDYLAISRVDPKYPAISLGESDIDGFRDDIPFEPFKDKCKLRFMWYYDSYLETIQAAAQKHKDNEKFEKMPFEGAGNIMDGVFNYTSLQNRLARVKQEIENETEEWARQGKIALDKEQSIATNVQRQFEQTKESFRNKDAIHLDIEQVDKNPFVWELTLMGRHMSNLDGGIFKIKMCISPRFPSEQPRVKVTTPLFHHRVAKDGQLCYFINNSDNLCAHVEAIVAAIEDESPAYDPRTLVNPEASKLLWGTPDQKKQYNRRLRRSAQESVEFL